MRKYNCSVTILVIVVTSSISCKSPEEPEIEEPRQYRDMVLVTYVRDSNKILFPEGKDSFMRVKYELYDPDAEKHLNTDPSDGTSEYINGIYRIGATIVEKIGENEYQAYIKNVFIHNESSQPKHVTWVLDIKLYLNSKTDCQTADGVSVVGAYDVELKNNRMYFKMSKE